MSLESETSRPYSKPAKPVETNAQRKKRLREAEAKRQQLRQRFAQDDDAVLTFREWCALNGFSPRQGRRVLASGTGPVVMNLTAKRLGITRGANRAWQESRSR
jgi:hypothetical protein